MNQEQLNKMGDFFDSKYKQEAQNVDDDYNTEPVEGRSLLLNEVSRADELNTRANNFLDVEYGSHKKCRNMTRTKWDKFAPYAFSKLEKQTKIETFLQLFEDYNHLKERHNEEIDKNKKMMAKMVGLESDISKIKSSSALSPAERIRMEKDKNKEVEGMRVEIRRLHQKILALTGTSHKITKRPSTANKTSHKMAIPVNQNIKTELQAERKQVRELLLIVDDLKRVKYQLEDQLKEKQQNNQSSVRGQKNVSKIVAANKGNSDSQFYEYTNQLMTWKQKYNDLELIFNRAIEDKDKKIRDISSELITIKENERMKSKVDRRTGHFDISETGKLQQRIKDLTNENQKLQTELRRLVKMPFYQNNTQLLDQQQKLSQLEVQYQRIKDDLSKSNQTSMKYFAELEYKTKEAVMLKEQNEKMKKQIRANFEKEQKKSGITVGDEIDYDDYYRRQLHLNKLEGDDPVWRKFSLISKPQFTNMTQKQVREQADKLWCSKIELLAHLEKAHTELASIKSNMDSRINIYLRDKEYLQEQLRVTRARLDEWMSMERINVRRDFQVYEQGGVKYDDTVSVFDVEEAELKELDSNQNYFDLYLGHINIDESMLLKNPQNKIKNTSHFVSFLTVDFYNHETQHSDFAQGVVKKLNNNYSFKVEVTPYYLKYLSKNSINLELWSPQGTATVLLGKGKIYLSELITKASKEISNVIRGKCQVYFNDKFLIASVQYRIRMRLPISPFIEWAESKHQFSQSIAKNPLALGKNKMLGISVERAEGLPAEIKAFVYFTVQNEDFFSEPEKGPSPLWDFHCEVPVTLDDDFADQLKQKYFQFTIFDDEKEVNEDVYGVAKASFTPLVDSVDCLSLNLDIENKRGELVGKLKVKAEWINV